MQMSDIRHGRPGPSAALLSAVAAALLVTLPPLHAGVRSHGPGADPTLSVPCGVSVSTDRASGVAVLHGWVRRPIERLFAHRAVLARADVVHVIDATIVAPAPDGELRAANDLVGSGTKRVRMDDAGTLIAHRGGG